MPKWRHIDVDVILYDVISTINARWVQLVIYPGINRDLRRLTSWKNQPLYFVALNADFYSTAVYVV